MESERTGSGSTVLRSGKECGAIPKTWISIHLLLLLLRLLSAQPVGNKTQITTRCKVLRPLPSSRSSSRDAFKTRGA